MRGSLVAVDLGSTNGLFVAGSADRVSRVVLSDRVDLRIGRMRIRIRAPDSVIAPAVKDRTNAVTGGHFGTPLAGAAAFAITLLALSLRGYLSSYERANVSALTVEVLPILALVALWAGLVLRQPSRCPRVPLLLASGRGLWAMVAAILLSAGLEYYSFLFNGDSSDVVVGASTWTIVTGLLLYGHVRLASQQPRRHLVGWAVGLSIMVQGLLVVVDRAGEEEFTTDPEFPHQLKPVSTHSSGQERR